MKRQIKLTEQILLTAGVIEIAAGLLHFAMPSIAYQSKGFSLLHPDEINFVTLVVFAVGILLVAFGSLTIFFSKKVETAAEIVYTYVVIKTVLWIGRVVLEILYPVNLNMFNIEPFTLVVLPGIIIEMLLFVVSVVLMKKVMVAKNT
jgi:hypothetical protein